jgi:hypothetical protein
MASTILLETPVPCPADELDFARDFIAACAFTYAKSVPDSPHEYCLRVWLDDQHKGDFDRFTKLITQIGYKGKFMTTVYTYLDVDGWRYWQSRTINGTGRIINRANNDTAPVIMPGMPLAAGEPAQLELAIGDGEPPGDEEPRPATMMRLNQLRSAWGHDVAVTLLAENEHSFVLRVAPLRPTAGWDVEVWHDAAGNPIALRRAA